MVPPCAVVPTFSQATQIPPYKFPFSKLPDPKDFRAKVNVFPESKLIVLDISYKNESPLYPIYSCKAVYV